MSQSWRAIRRVRVSAGLVLVALAIALAFSTAACSNGTTGDRAATSGSINSPGARSPQDSANALEANGKVVRVVDGDTLVIDTGDEDERVRLIGIDTPETVHPSKPVMCFGKKASAHMSELLPESTEVHLERDVEARDRYGRLLAYVYRASDGLFVNLEMVQAGYAKQATYPPNVAHVDEFGEAMRRARADDIGLWSACDKPFEE